MFLHCINSLIIHWEKRLIYQSGFACSCLRVLSNDCNSGKRIIKGTPIKKVKNCLKCWSEPRNWSRLSPIIGPLSFRSASSFVWYITRAHVSHLSAAVFGHRAWPPRVSFALAPRQVTGSLCCINIIVMRHAAPDELFICRKECLVKKKTKEKAQSYATVGQRG